MRAYSEIFINFINFLLIIAK